jgi:hypothetical protein
LQIAEKEARLAQLQSTAAAAAASQAKAERGWLGGLASFVLPASREAEQARALQSHVFPVLPHTPIPETPASSPEVASGIVHHQLHHSKCTAHAQLEI